jgi:hypothetical protein
MLVSANISTLAREKFHPAVAGFEIHRAELPATGGVIDAGAEASLLLLIAHRKPILEQHDLRAHQHALEFQAGKQKLLHLLGGAKAHHLLHAGAVIPAAIEEHHLAGGGEVLHIALEIPLALLAVGGLTEGHHLTAARIKRLGDPFIVPPIPAASRPSNSTSRR